MELRNLHSAIRPLGLLCGILAPILLQSGAACQQPPAHPNRPTAAQQEVPLPSRTAIEAQAGIEVIALRLSGNGNLLDLRYKVKDPQKAHAILGRQSKPMLVDPVTGHKFIVPDMAYVGALRQTAVAPEAGKTYFILFGNPVRTIHRGQKLDLVLGDLTLHGIPVE